MQADDITIILVGDLTDDPILTVRVVTPRGTLTFMGEIDVQERSIAVRQLHIGGDPAVHWGWWQLRTLALSILEKLDVDEIQLVGAIRTTGANPGRRPRLFRIARSSRAPPGSGTEHA